jgi:hypothetical protein
MSKGKNTAGASAPATTEKVETESTATTETVQVDPVVATLQAENAALKAELADATKVVAELKEKLKDGKSVELTVKVGGKKYAVVGGFKKNGQLFTKEAIAADAKLAEELIAKGSQLLTEIA